LILDAQNQLVLKKNFFILAFFVFSFCSNAQSSKFFEVNDSTDLRELFEVNSGNTPNVTLTSSASYYVSFDRGVVTLSDMSELIMVKIDYDIANAMYQSLKSKRLETSEGVFLLRGNRSDCITMTRGGEHFMLVVDGYAIYCEASDLVFSKRFRDIKREFDEKNQNLKNN